MQHYIMVDTASVRVEGKEALHQQAEDYNNVDGDEEVMKTGCHPV